MRNLHFYKFISLCFTLLILLIPAAKAEVGNLYSAPSLESLFATRPLDATAKTDVSEVLDSLHTQYLNETDPTFKNALLAEIRKQEPQSSQAEEAKDKLVVWTAQCLTKYAIEKLDSAGLFNNGVQLPRDVLDQTFFKDSTEVCYLRGNGVYTMDRINRAEAKRRQANMKSVNDVLLNGDKYDRGIYVSGYFIYDHKGPSLLLHSQSNINRVFVDTRNLEDKYLRKVMECSLGCNLQFLGRVDNYNRHYIIKVFQVYDAPN